VDHRRVLQQVVAWARGEDNIRVVVLTGSVARGEGGFDELSDLDLELYVSDPSQLLDQDTWYQQFGDVLVLEALENPGWHPTRPVYYADGKIDFMIAPTGVLARGILKARNRIATFRYFRLPITSDCVCRYTKHSLSHGAYPHPCATERTLWRNNRWQSEQDGS
jgi:predicted nucleotidyltransferase